MSRQLRKLSAEALAELERLRAESGEPRANVWAHGDWGAADVAVAPVRWGYPQCTGEFRTIRFDEERFPALAKACDVRVPEAEEPPPDYRYDE